MKVSCWVHFNLELAENNCLCFGNLRVAPLSSCGRTNRWPLAAWRDTFLRGPMANWGELLGLLDGEGGYFYIFIVIEKWWWASNLSARVQFPNEQSAMIERTKVAPLRVKLALSAREQPHCVASASVRVALCECLPVWSCLADRLPLLVCPKQWEEPAHCLSRAELLWPLPLWCLSLSLSLSFVSGSPPDAQLPHLVTQYS